MQTVTVEEAQVQLARLISQIGDVGDVVITQNDKPIAKLVPAEVQEINTGKPRPQLGSAKGMFTLAPDFDEPITDFEECQWRRWRFEATCKLLFRPYLCLPMRLKLPVKDSSLLKSLQMLNQTTVCCVLFAALAAVWSGTALAMYDPATYNADNPTFVNDDFTPTQKEAQRAAGKATMDALVTAAKSGAASYTIAPGTYRVPSATYRLENISHFTVHCPHVNIWLDIQPRYTDQTDLSWINFKNCSDIKILGGDTDFDSERLQFVQATITGWDAAAGSMDIQVMPGYDATDFPAKTEGNMSWTYNRQGVCLTRPVYSSVANIDAQDPTKKRLMVGAKYFTGGTGRLLQKGDIFFTRHNLAEWSSVLSTDRSNTNFEIVGIHSWYGPMWAIDCTRGSFICRDCSNYRRPGTNRIGGSQEPFIYANMHTLVWDHCTTGGPGQDDGIDVVGGYALVAEVQGPHTLTLFREPTVGETLSFYDPATFAPEGEATVQSVTPRANAEPTAALRSGVNQFQASLGARLTVSEADKFWVVTLDKDLPVRPFSGYDSSTQSPDVTITNCYFADMNAQAIFAKGHKITITGNRIDRGNATAIHAQISRYWWEGPVPQNVNVSHNDINDNPANYGAPGGTWDWALSSIGVEIEGSLSGVGAIHNVHIEGNRLFRSARIPIMIKNVSDVVIRNNTIIAAMPKPVAGASLSYVTY